MALFPSEVFTQDNVKFRWREPYASEGVNKKFLGIPYGCYLGFAPAPNPGDTVNKLDLNLDSVQSLSVLRAKSTLSQASVDLVVEAALTLDFTGHVVFPVYVFAETSYKAGQTSSAIITTSSTAPNGITQIGICKITAPDIGGSTLGVDHLQFDPQNAPDRHAPIAYSGVPFGFMLGGAEEDRQAASAAVVDIDAAKTDTLSVVHPTLADRLTADFDEEQLGGRMGKNIISISSNDEVEVTGSSLNMSHSFAGVSRTSAPSIDFAGEGSESADGAITSPSDTDRNIVGIQDVASGRPYADPSTGRPVFGRLVYAEFLDGTTSLTFADGSVVVAVAGTDPTPNVNPGDIIIDPEGNFAPVSRTPGSVGPATITLAQAWNRTDPAGPLVGTLNRRRFTVNFFTRLGSVETAYSVVREAFLDVPSWVGAGFGLSSPQTPEPYSTDAGATQAGVIVRQAYNGDPSILYVPDDPDDILLAIDTVNEVGGVTKEMVPAAGTPTQDAPDLRFFIPTFQPINEARSDQKSTFLQAPTTLIPRASENFDGLTRFATIETGVERFTALQANDSRVLSVDEAAAAAAAAAPTGANPFATVADTNVHDLASKASAFGRWGKTGEFGAAAPARTVVTFSSEGTDNHPSQLMATVDGSGVITLVRPPTGIRYHYSIAYTGASSNVAGNNSRFIIAESGTVSAISGLGGHGKGGGVDWSGGETVVADVAVDSIAAGATLPILFEIQRQGTTAQANTPNSRLFITRTARAE